MRVVLTVGVELDRALVAAPDREREPGAQRPADAEVERERRHVDARGPGELRGAVGGAVGHHQHVVLGSLLGELLEHRGQRLLLVVRGDDDERPRVHPRAHALTAGRRHNEDTGLSLSRRNGFSTR